MRNGSREDVNITASVWRDAENVTIIYEGFPYKQTTPTRIQNPFKHNALSTATTTASRLELTQLQLTA